MRSFLHDLLEGTYSTAKVDITTNEEVEKEVNESCLPMGMLIESVSTDITIGLNRAVEVYEMACIVGGVKVVQEGTGSYQEDAAELLTEASDNFFSKILEKIKKIKDWFVAMIKKIGNKIASLFTNIDKAWAKYEADYRKKFEAGKFKFTGHIIDLNAGAEFIEEISDAAKEFIGEISEKLGDPSKLTEEGEKEMTVENLFKKVSKAIGKEVKNSAEVTDALKEAMKVDKESKEIIVSAEDSNTMTDVIIAATKVSQKAFKNYIDLLVSSCNVLVKRVEAIKKQSGENTVAVKYCTNAVTILNTMSSSVLATLANTYSTSVAQAAKAYIGFVTKVAQGKGVAESMDFSHIFENDEIDDEVEGVEERTMFANVKALETWFGESVNNTKDLLKEANREFNGGNYKKAKELYTRAKSECQVAVKELDGIDQNIWTTVFGVVLWGWYYALWRIVAHCIVVATTPVMKTIDIPSSELKTMEKKCSKSMMGTQKVIGEVLEKVIAFCDYQIKVCGDPKKYQMEGCELPTDEFSSVFEHIDAIIESAVKSAENDDVTHVKESASILDIANSLL